MNVDSGSTLAMKDIDIVRDIPYRSVDMVHSKFDVGQYIYNDLVKPYIEVRRQIPVGGGSCIRGIRTNLCGVLGEFEGYVRVDSVDVVGRATQGEKELIERLLMDGVRINNK